MTIRAAFVLIEESDGSVVATSRRGEPGKLGLPGGKLDMGETPADAAVRETAEETGLVVRVSGPVYTGEPDGVEGTGFLCAVFVGQVVGRSDQRPEDADVSVQTVRPEALWAVGQPFPLFNRAAWQSR